MILYPAIDLKDGKAVRLLRGDMNKSTVFNDSPVDQALSFVGQNCQWLHLVDLNGAFSGKPINAEAVEEILQNCNIPIQLGGCLLYTSPSPRDLSTSRMPSSA